MSRVLGTVQVMLEQKGGGELLHVMSFRPTGRTERATIGMMSQVLMKGVFLTTTGGGAMVEQSELSTGMTVAGTSSMGLLVGVMKSNTTWSTNKKELVPTPDEFI